MLNSVNLVGRLVRDPELKRSQTGKSYARFDLAVDRRKKEEGADFLRIVVWGNTAEAVCQYCGQGSLVSVAGRITTGYQDKEGKRTYYTDIVASDVCFLQTKHKENAPIVEGDDDKLSDDDLPF